MNWKNEWKSLAVILAVFLGCYYLPIDDARFENALLEAVYLVRWYAREHVLLCLVPAFFIAGAIAVFINRAAVVRYLGAGAHKILAYGVAALSGTILAVCSCTVLPLFSSIHRMGAGLGPAITFLYSGPAINILAIILTARILGPELGFARAIGAMLFSIVIGLIMHALYRKEEKERAETVHFVEKENLRPLWQMGLYFASMVGILIFANWGRPDQDAGLWAMIYAQKWIITSVFVAVFAVILNLWFSVDRWKIAVMALAVIAAASAFPALPMVPFTVGVIGLSFFTSMDEKENGAWFEASWSFAKQILPLLLFGVLVAGLLLGRIGHEGLIPSHWVSEAVGGNSLAANFFASMAGAFMYFATLTEVPIVQGLIENGMGKGPALALLLAGPAVSLPSMLVIRSVLGTQKTIVFVSLVIVMATLSGLVFGALVM